MIKQKISIFFAGLIIGALVFSSSVAYAWTGQLQVDFIPLNYFFNDVQKHPPGDQQGFIYNGRTYVPLRFVAEASGLAVDWDGSTNSIYISGSNSSSRQNNAGKYLSDVLQPYYFDFDELTINETMKTGGTTYYKGFYIKPWNFKDDGKMSFNLAGQYSQINGVIGLSDDLNTVDSSVVIYGDNNVLASFELKAGSLPRDFSVNVSGVSKFDVMVKPSYAWPSAVVLCNVVVN